jgi:glycosyltransferase involved in cell wall biosynthesis
MGLSMTKLSIITVTKDDHQNLLKTLNSIQMLDKNALALVQLIVVDGGTGQASSNILNEIAEHKYIKEADTGVFNAMNKGWKHANGDYIIFMNSGDVFHPNFKIDSLFEFLQEYKPLWCIGQALYLDNKKSLKKWKIPNLKSQKLYFGFNSFPHQATFYSQFVNKLFEFSEDTLFADWELSLKLCEYEKPIYFNDSTSINDVAGLSAKFSTYSRAREYARIRKRVGLNWEFLGSFEWIVIYAMWLLRNFYKTIARGSSV